jgi:hypothetical protein
MRSEEEMPDLILDAEDVGTLFICLAKKTDETSLRLPTSSHS